MINSKQLHVYMYITQKFKWKKHYDRIFSSGSHNFDVIDTAKTIDQFKLWKLDAVKKKEPETARMAISFL